MTEKKKSRRQQFLDGDLDGIPVSMDDIKDDYHDFSDDDFDYKQKCGFTDNLYIAMGIDLRWLKRFNPKDHIIF